MTAQETNLSNFFETTLNGTLASSAFNAGTGSQQLTNAPTSNGTDAIAAKFYLVIDPDNTSREVVLVNTISGTEITAMTRDVENRHGLTKPEHTSGTVVRMSVVKEMFEDIHDRIDANVPPYTLGTQTNGNYVADVSAGNGLSKTSSASEGQTVDLQVDIAGSTDGSGIVVDVENDLVLLYDNSATAVKKVKASQIATPQDVHPFLVMGG